VSLSADSSLPEGNYAVEILMNGEPMFSETVTVGSGTRPSAAPEAEADDVFITGQVVDALTGDGIAGAMVAILDVALESPQFTWNESEILSQAITDRGGRFVLPVPVKQGNFYTIYVFAEGFVTIVEDNFTIPSDQPSPTDIRIEMNHP
ncbi:MAG: carboxypeptidase-like regulatory domain-containing protein, partial [Anaerolineae bacterium]